MRILGPVRAHGTCLGRSPLSSPTRSPGSRCEAGAPAPEPAEKFRRCKREKMQLSRTPAPTPSARPHPRSPTPGGGDLGHPGCSRKMEEGLPSGVSRGLPEAPTGHGDLSLRRQPPGQAHPAPACAPSAPPPAFLLPLLRSPADPLAPLCASLLPDPPGRPTYPALRRPGLGQGGLHQGGTHRSGRPSLSGDFFISLPNSRCLSLLSLFSPHPHPSFSLVSRLFFPG